MKALACAFLLAALAFTALADVNVTGKWSGSFNVSAPNGETKDSTALLMLTQSGNQITGSVGPDEGEQYQIKKGSIEGDKITLEVEHDGDVIRFNLVLAEEHIQGNAEFNRNGEIAKAKIDVTRAR